MIAKDRPLLSEAKLTIVWYGTGWTVEGSEFDSRKGQELSILHVVHTSSVAHPASYQMGTGGPFPRG
jgi:hypothetical protein